MIAITVALAATVAFPADAATPYLHADGTRMVDGAGKTVILRGVNTGAWLFYDPFWYDGGLGLEGTWDQGEDVAHTITPQMRALIGSHPVHSVSEIKRAFWSNDFTQADVLALKRDGFNSIRVPIDYRLFSTYTIDAAGHHVAVPDASAPGYAYLDKAVGWCKAAGMYAVIDMHIAPYGFSDDQQSLDSLKRVWQALARRYAANPAVGAYDLLNEPNWNGAKYSLHATGASQDYNTGSQYVAQQLIDAIRQVDPHHLLIVEGFMFGDRLDSVFYDPASGKRSNTLQLHDPQHNLALSYHRYGGNLPDSYDASKDPGPDGSHYWWDADPEFKLQHVKLLASMAHTPLWIGEFGNNQNMWYRDLVDCAERSTDPTDHGVSAGWCLWTYKKGGFDVVSDCPLTPGMQTLATYFDAMNRYWKKSDGPAPTPAFTPEQADTWLYDGALKTNYQYCRTNRDEVDALLRPDFRTRAIPYVSEVTVPGKIFACDYDMGAQGVSYHDTDSDNDTWDYRCDGVDLAPCADLGPGPGYKVIDFQCGEWMHYTVDCRPGTYSLSVRYALASDPSASLRVKIVGADQSADIDLPPTGSWTTYQTATTPGFVVRSRGKAVLEILCERGCDLNWIALN